jgi:Ca-activated chloride channel family protein
MLPRTDRPRWVLPAAALVLVLGAALVLAAHSHAASTQKKTDQQDDRKKPVKPELESKSPQVPQKDFRIGVNVDLVVLYTSVLDKTGQFVSGLKQENFKVFEDGVGQNMLSFSQEDAPISLGIVLDTSGSMRSKFDNVIKAALAFIHASNPDDEVFLVGFNDEVELLEDFTSDIDTISDTLNNTIVTGGTALWDAIYLSVQKAHSGTRPKKALVVITDGEDRDSYYKLDEMVAKVQESDVQVYCIGLLDEVPDKGMFGHWSKTEPEKAHDALQRIADETGAKAFFPKDIREINTIVSQIAYELRNQYSISYISSNQARDGTWRRLKVALDATGSNTMRVRYRPGYFAPRSDAGK